MEKNKSKSLNINKSVICYRNNFNKKQIDEIFKTIIALFKFNFPELMKDIYGNYFCQKLIQCCSSEQKLPSSCHNLQTSGAFFTPF